MSLHRFLVATFFAIAVFPLQAQIVNTATMDTAALTYNGKVGVGAYIDLYYAHNFNQPPSKNQPYAVSMNRTNEMTVNLGYVDVKYSSSRLRARFVPGFGTYVNTNYSKESGAMKNIIEANIGVKLFSKKNIWIDVGVLGSPYTNESYVSKDHLTYTRSLAAENVPYYLSGIKLTLPVSKKVNTYYYLVNGWQQIQDQNSTPAGGTQVEYRPNNNLLINWDTFFGEERSATDTTSRMRYFSDIYFIYSKGKFDATGCVYGGVQERAQGQDLWWQANLIGRYHFTSKLSASARAEYFSDPHEVMQVPITGVQGFQTYGSSLGLNYKPADNILMRLEGRTFFSDRELFLRNGTAVNSSTTITGNLTIWF